MNERITPPSRQRLPRPRYGSAGEVLWLWLAIIDDLELSVVSSTAAAERRRLEVFPNPSSGFFNCVLPEGFTAGTLSVIDARGQAVLLRAISRTTFSGGIDLSGLPSGVYFLELRPALGSVEVRYGQRVVKVD